MKTGGKVLVLWALAALAPLHARAADEYREVPPPTPEEVIPVPRGDATFSESFKRRNAGQRLEGKYLVYCSRDGNVVRVEPQQPIPGADAAVIANIKSRHFPATRPIKFELWVSLDFEAEAPPAPPPPPVVAAPPPPPPPPPPASTLPAKKYRAVQLPVLEEGAIDEAPPQVKAGDGKGAIGAYMIFVEPDGSVSRVEVVQTAGAVDNAIITRMRGWRFKPQRERVRTVVRFTVGPSGAEKF